MEVTFILAVVSLFPYWWNLRLPSAIKYASLWNGPRMHGLLFADLTLGVTFVAQTAFCKFSPLGQYSILRCGVQMTNDEKKLWFCGFSRCFLKSWIFHDTICILLIIMHTPTKEEVSRYILIYSPRHHNCTNFDQIVCFSICLIGKLTKTCVIVWPH